MAPPDPSEPFALDFERRLDGLEPDGDAPAATPDQAAVAAVLRPTRHGPEVLLMVRADRPGDRWSGQVALPGGKAEPEDPHLLATAVRETAEEVGLDLDRHARPLCRLPGLQARARGGPVGLFITPYVFHATDPGPLDLGPEAADAFWLPLAQAANGHLDDRYRLRRGEGDLLLPAWRFADRTIWGLTHRMLSGLVDRLR